MKPPSRWPLILIAAPAAVAIWSGWVGLGQLCGFGLVQPFPGIVSWHLDTAITLPVGVEAYGAYATTDETQKLIIEAEKHVPYWFRW